MRQVEGVLHMTRADVGVLYEVAGRAAAAHVAARGLPAHMRDDLTQEGVLWLLEHPERLVRAEGEGVRNTSQVVAEIRRHYVSSRADLPPGSSTDEHDSQRYTPDMIAMVFPALFDPEYVPFREEEQQERFAEKDPSESNTWFAMIADVRRAVDAYGPGSENVRLVFQHDVEHRTFQSIAQEEGTSDFPVRTRYHDTIRWMANWLNGDPQE